MYRRAICHLFSCHVMVQGHYRERVKQKEWRMYRWGLTASSLGEADWAVKAFQYLLQHHPTSSVAEAALPRAAGALLSGGRPDQALARYAEYFQKFGHEPSAAPVARAAAWAAFTRSGVSVLKPVMAPLPPRAAATPATAVP